jgi:hypothetical protein
MTEIEHLREENILLKRKIIELEAEIKFLNKKNTWHYTTEFPTQIKLRTIEG